MERRGLESDRRSVLFLAGALTSLAYFVVAVLSISARTITPSISPIWPAAGIGLASAMTFGCAASCPWVFLASLGAGALLHLPPAAALAMAFSNSLEVFIAGQLLLRSHLDGYSFYGPAEFAVYSFLTGLSAAAASALTVAVFAKTGTLGEVSFGFSFLTRALAHWTGMLTVTPLLLLWRYHPRFSGKFAHTAEGVGAAVVSAGVCYLLFSGRTVASLERVPLSFLLLPLALWPAMRQGLRETASVIMFTLAAALYGTVHDVGPFAGASRAASVTVLQGFLAVETIVAMSLASSVWRAKDNALELEAARRRLRLVLDASAGYIAYLDRELTFRLANAKFQEWTHASPETLLGRSMLEVAGPQNYRTLEPLVRRALAGQAVRELIMQKDREGKQHWMDMQFQPDADQNGFVRGAIMLAVDVTSLKTTEQALRAAERQLTALNRDLERRVEKRTSRLRQVNDELESFAYTVAHDLRSPLRKMSGFSEAVLRDYEGRLDTKGVQFLHRIFDASRRMGRLIDDMLALSLVTRSEVRDERVDLSALAGAIVEELRQADPERKVTIKVSKGLETRGDPGLLEAALRNLLDNAWKFTRPKTDALIEVGATPREGAGPVFYVRDNGVGFDMEGHSRLFGAFERLHSREEFPGTGIGLATVQRVIQRHDGRIWAEGEPGKGATFSFTLHDRS